MPLPKLLALWMVCRISDVTKGLIITTLGVLFIVPDSLFVRLIEAEPMVTAFWRALMAGFVVLVFVLFAQGPRAFVPVFATGWPGWLYMILIGTSAPAFVLAITQTSVANVVFIFATMPIFAAGWSWVLLREPVSRRIVWTMLAAMVGFAIIAYGSHASALANWRGDIWALYIAVSYGLALTLLRKVRETSMVPSVPIAFIGSACLLWLVSDPFSAFAASWPLFLGHGFFMGVATCLLTLGPRYIGSTEVALLVLLESVLAPILVWAVIGEDPGAWAIAGGTIVVGALVVSNLVAIRQSRR